jgi:hypothetical protein|nr:MAG TPA: hypothetical protein [Caudoviricetes sp.]
MENNKKDVKKVVKGKVNVKKKNDLAKVKDVFIAEDASKVKSYILFDIVIPEAKKILSEIVNTSLDMILYGERRENRRKSGGTNSSYVSYRNYSDDKSRISSRHNDYDFDELLFADKEDADDVLDALCEIIGTYGYASVSDLYDLCGRTCDYTAASYGWRNLSSASVVRLPGGDYRLKLPKVRVIDQ